MVNAQCNVSPNWHVFGTDVAITHELGKVYMVGPLNLDKLRVH